MWNSAAMAFGLGPLLTMAAVDALVAHGSDELKRAYLAKLVSGEWMGTMQLTEPQAGSDVGALRTRAERMADGSYRITGQKIFITYGEHDLTENIIHMVLARLPDAPAGSKGISLFLVPKFLPDDGGAPVELQRAATLTVTYSIDQLRAASIGSGVQLALVRRDGATWRRLTPCDGCILDTEHHLMSAPLEGWGEFALVGERNILLLPLVRWSGDR